MPMRPLVLLTLALAAACSSTPAPKLATYQPSDVRELAAMPVGYSAGSTLRESCSRMPRGTAYDNVSLANVDCNEARLSRLLRARAGEEGRRFIVGKSCRSRGGARGRVECSATLAVPGPSVGLDPHGVAWDPGPAPSAAQVQDLDEPRPQDAGQIRVAFEPTQLGARAAFSPRAYDAVAETHWPSVGRAELGQVSARCESCDPLQLRHALRASAGHAGAGEVTSVKCFQDDGGLRCVATALAPWRS
jgi:hypothetical protein